MKIQNILSRLSGIFLLVLFMPILLGILFFSEIIKYPDYYRNSSTVPNGVFFIGVVLLTTVLFLLIYSLSKIKIKEKTVNITFTVLVALFFVFLFFINQEISKCAIFYTGWGDVRNVQYLAYNRLYNGVAVNSTDWYLTVYPNNLTIVYIFYVLHSINQKIFGSFYLPEYFFMQANLVVISATGFFVTMATKRITKNYCIAALAAGLFTLALGISPWMTICYTDMYGMLLPACCVYLYAVFKDCNSSVRKILLWCGISLLGVIAGMIKPTTYICLIAIVITEVVHLLTDMKSSWKSFIAYMLVLLISLVLIKAGLNSYITKTLGYEPNAGVAVTWSHYLNMGANSESMGTCNAEDSGLMFGKYMEDGVARKKAELESFASRIKGRGLTGNISFYYRKLVMTFNDGAFGWYREGIDKFWLSEFPSMTERGFKQSIQNYYWKDGKYYGVFEGFSQFVWLFILCGIPGGAIASVNKYRENRGYMLLSVTTIGVILFQMLFETRARYLICMVPLLIVLSATGYMVYYNYINSIINKCIKRAK